MPLDPEKRKTIAEAFGIAFLPMIVLGSIVAAVWPAAAIPVAVAAFSFPVVAAAIYPYSHRLSQIEDKSKERVGNVIIIVGLLMMLWGGTPHDPTGTLAWPCFIAGIVVTAFGVWVGYLS
jgi:hypothetical protein